MPEQAHESHLQPDPGNDREKTGVPLSEHAAHDHAQDSPAAADRPHPSHGQHPEHGQKQAGHSGHEAHTDHTGHERLFRNRFWICLGLSIPVLLYSEVVQGWLGFAMPVFPGSEWITPVFAVFVFAIGGVPFLQMAQPELDARRPGMMSLISLAIGVAFVYSLATTFFPLGESFYWELVTLIDVMLLGHWLEMRSVRQASSALGELAKLMPDTAERIRADGTPERIPVTSLQVADLVLVRPGESVPADGEVVEGRAAVNEAMITGESNAVDKEPGSRVIGGTINGDGSLRVRVTATGDETALAGIMRLVADAQASRSDTQILADKAAGWLFYIAVSAALLTAVGWTLAAGFDVVVLKRVTTVLVIACPHALGLAIPLVVAITTSLGARNGILIRDRLALEAARSLNVVVFDKTGTLTEGAFGLVKQVAVEGWEEDQALALAAAIEGDSEHAIAKAFRIEAEKRGLQVPAVNAFEAVKGKGVRAVYNGQPVYIGGPRLLTELGPAVSLELGKFAEAGNRKGHTVVYLIDRDRAVAAFSLADRVRPESLAAVSKLRAMGIRVAMLTGDSRQVAESVAADLDIDQVYAEVLPEHKDQKIAEIRSEGARVAMVGDGVNDAPALARADVGIAIGSGTDVAIESAGIILVQSNPLDIVRVIELSRASYRKMVQNLIWASGYNIIAIPLAAGALAPWGILISPAVGALFMSLSTVIVAINAQFLRSTDL